MGLPRLGAWLIACVLMICSAKAQPVQGVNAEALGWHARIVRVDTGISPSSSAHAPIRSEAEPSAASVSTQASMDVSWATLLGLAGTALLPVLAWLALVTRRDVQPDAAISPIETARGIMPVPQDGEPPAAPSDTIEIETLHGRAARLAIEIRENLDRLPTSMPLRQVLAREFASAASGLDTLLSEDQASVGSRAGGLRRLRALVSDLNRLGEISAGARSSLAEHAPADPTSQPKTTADAYQLLGINADVDERISKKLVDALRQSWHPDLARDEADRQHREERMKAINVAWDLIRSRSA